MKEVKRVEVGGVYKGLVVKRVAELKIIGFTWHRGGIRIRRRRGGEFSKNREERQMLED